MSQMSDYLEGQLRAHIFRTASFAKPTNLYVSLHTANPADDATGAEATYGSYTRVLRAPLDANWTAGTATDGIITNAAIVTFPASSSGTNIITHFAIWDALSAGNMLCYGTLSVSITVTTGVTPAFAIGGITITFQ